MQNVKLTKEGDGVLNNVHKNLARHKTPVDRGTRGENTGREIGMNSTSHLPGLYS